MCAGVYSLLGEHFSEDVPSRTVTTSLFLLSSSVRVSSLWSGKLHAGVQTPRTAAASPAIKKSTCQNYHLSSYTKKTESKMEARLQMSSTCSRSVRGLLRFSNSPSVRARKAGRGSSGPCTRPNILLQIRLWLLAGKKTVLNSSQRSIHDTTCDLSTSNHFLVSSARKRGSSLRI